MSKNSQPITKWKTYVVTFCTYVALHSMRMTYSHVVPQFKEVFQQTNLYLGLFDASIYLALSFGFSLRFLLEGKRHLLTSFILFMSLACLGYLFIPVSSLLLEQKVTSNIFFHKILPGLGLLMFGFCQFAAWPTVMILINQHFNIKSEGTALGVWSAHGDVGNVVGFSIAGLMVDNLSYRWEVAMIAVTVLCWVMAWMLYVFIEEKHSQEENLLLQEQTSVIARSQEEDSQHSKFVAFVGNSLKSTELILYLLAMGLLKSILYGFLLWMPTYLTHNHMAAQKSTIPIVFNLGTLIGSFILGSLYEDINMEQSESFNSFRQHIKVYALFYACIGVVASLTVFYFIKASIAVYFVCSIVSGAFLGGCFNMLAGNEVFAIARGCRRKLSYLSTLSMVCGNFCVGVVEIVIGVVLDMKNDPQGEHKLFVILITVGCMAIVVLFCRSRLLSGRDYTQVETQPRVIKQ